MSFFEDYWKKFTGKDLDLSDISFGDVASGAANMFVADKLSDLTRVNKPPVGYQGKIEDRRAVRSRIDRPAGDAGRRTGILSAVEADVKTMDDMDFAGTDFTGMTPELVTAKKEELLAEENARLQKVADDKGIAQGDIYASSPGNRRPGGAGRRYFTDMQYAKPDDTSKKVLSESEARTASTRQKLAMEGKTEEEIDEIMNPAPVVEETAGLAMGGRVPKYAQGGIAGTHKGYYLGGKTDGMADKVPARIDGNQEARLSDGEFVIPADVVSHLGNGNSDAGAQQLHSMMNGVRQARTGNPEQGKQINPQQFMPKMAQGGLAQYARGGNVNAVQGVNSRFKNQPYTTKFSGLDPDPTGDTEGTMDASPDGAGEQAGTAIGTDENLANWAGDYVTNMLSEGRALGTQDYEHYAGPLTAGSSTLQDQAITGISNLNNPLSGSSITNQMGAFKPDAATLDPYMNPYTDQVIDRTAAGMRRQSQIDALQQQQQLTSAGAFGGSRDALMRAEMANNLNRGIGDMAAEQRALNFNNAMDRAKAAQEMTNQYGFDVLAAQGAAGEVQRGIASEGVKADYAQFREEREYPYKQVQYMQSLLQGLPIDAQQTVYSEPSDLQQYFETAGGLEAYLKYLGATENSGENNTSDATTDTSAAAEDEPDMANPYRESNI
jgi:hypothetical protein